jgi:hypothetical protein
VTIGWYAPVVVLLGLLCWLRGSLIDSVLVMLFFSLFDGGAAFTVGGSSIQPVAFSMVFLLAHAMLLLPRPGNHLNLGLKTNGFLAFYCLYGAIAAFLLPRLFARTMLVPPMLLNKRNIYYVNLLFPSSQNITTAGYLLGTLITSVCAGAAAADPKSRRALVKWSVVFAWLQVGFGVAGVVAEKVGLQSFIAFFRNAKYAELDETTGGLVRIAGISPEPSAYGAHAFFWFVLMTEFWLRQVRPKWTGPAAGALLVMIILCTSSTAYFSLAAYGALMLVRWLIAPNGVRPVKLAIVGMGGLSALCLCLGMAAFVPKFAQLIATAISNMTVHKLDSTSGMARAFWVKSGITAFVKSYGIGIGPGSFRSSSLITAILGSTGVIGFAAFAGQVLNIFRPLEAETYRSSPSGDRVGVAAAWAACVGLFPLAISASGPEPGFAFAILGGLALGWRGLAVAKRPVVSNPRLIPVGPRTAGASPA